MEKSVSISGCDAFTYTYRIKDQLGFYIGWYPAHPSQIPVGIRAMGRTDNKSMELEKNLDILEIVASPNPFNSLVEVTVSTVAPDCLNVVVIDTRGRVVANLFKETLVVGTTRVSWDGKDDFGRTLPSGMYFIRAKSNQITRIKRSFWSSKWRKVMPIWKSAKYIIPIGFVFLWIPSLVVGVETGEVILKKSKTDFNMKKIEAGISHTVSSRQGGDDLNSAFVVPSLPFSDVGTTCGYNVDYHEFCPSISQGPDVVYSFSPEYDVVVTVDLCGSSYDTFIWIWDEQLSPVACNDDAYFYNDPCGDYVSRIDQAHLEKNTTYFIFISGYAGCGDYVLSISEYEDCILSCSGTMEGEPPIVDGYVDNYNGGCDSPGYSFQEILGDQFGGAVLCGTSGWYQGNDGESHSDTDWFSVVVGPTGTVHWVLEAEMATRGYQLPAGDCQSAFPPIINIPAYPCNQPNATLQGVPGEVLWIKIRASEDIPPTGFVGNEFHYICTFSGLSIGPVAVDKIGWGSLKSRFR